MPRAGDYGCVDNNGFIPWCIRIATRSHYSHAFIVLDDAGTIMEAEPGGARIRNVSEYAGRPIVYGTTPLTDAQRVVIVQTAKSLEGIPYGFMDIIYLGLEIADFRPRWLLNRVLDQHQMICSQLVAFCGVKAGVTAWLCGQPDAQLVTPAMLARLAAK